MIILDIIFGLLSIWSGWIILSGKTIEGEVPLVSRIIAIIMSYGGFKVLFDIVIELYLN